MQTNISRSKISAPNNLVITNVWNNAVTEIDRWHLMMSGMLLPALNTAYFKKTESVATIRLARLAVNIEHFRLLQGRLPLTLDELKTIESTEIKTDPFDGQPMRYRRLEKGYLIYSIDRDGEDNGGRECPANVKSTDKTHYDITFTIER